MLTYPIRSSPEPEGHIQWIDWDPLTARVVQTAPLVPKQGLEELLSGLHTMIKTRDTGNTNRIPKMLTDNGVVDVISELYLGDGDADSRSHFTTVRLTTTATTVTTTAASLHRFDAASGRLPQLLPR